MIVLQLQRLEGGVLRVFGGAPGEGGGVGRADLGADERDAAEAAIVAIAGDQRPLLRAQRHAHDGALSLGIDGRLASTNSGRASRAALAQRRIRPVPQRRQVRAADQIDREGRIALQVRRRRTAGSTGARPVRTLYFLCRLLMLIVKV